MPHLHTQEVHVERRVEKDTRSNGHDHRAELLVGTTEPPSVSERRTREFNYAIDGHCRKGRRHRKRGCVVTLRGNFGPEPTTLHAEMSVGLDLETGRLGDLETKLGWSWLGWTETSRPGDMETWRLGDFETWRLGDLETWGLAVVDPTNPMPRQSAG